MLDLPKSLLVICSLQLASEVYVQKKLLSTKMEGLQLHVASLLDKGNKSLELLDEVLFLLTIVVQTRIDVIGC